MPSVRRNPVSRARVESALARTLAGVGTAFFVQTLPVLFAQFDKDVIAWNVVAAGLLLVCLVAMIVTSVVRRGFRLVVVAFAAVFVATLVSWPFFVSDPTEDSPWLYGLVTVATAAAAYGLRVWQATVYLVAVPIVYALIRLTDAGGGVPPLRAVLDSTFSLVLGGAVLIIIQMLRAASSDVDRAQAAALERYAHVVRAHAIEAERVSVDAIVHDSVLTTLLSAARAETPQEKALAARMAGNAIGHLREAALVPAEERATTPIRTIARRIESAVEGLPVPFEVTTQRLGARSLPVSAAEAVYSAALQAAINSANHAGSAAQRSVLISGHDGGVRVVVADDGVGFDPHLIPQGRLGVRVSIVERMTSAGGLALVDSSPGGGTRVVVEWPAPAADGGDDR